MRETNSYTKEKRMLRRIDNSSITAKLVTLPLKSKTLVKYEMLNCIEEQYW